MKEEQLNVVHLMTGFGGGISTFIMNKANALKHDTDIKFNVITFDEVSKDFRISIESTGGHVFKVPSPKVNLFIFLKNVYDIFKHEKSENTVIHSHFGMNLVVVFYFIAKIVGIRRFLIHAHTDAPATVKYSKKNRFRRYLNSILAKEKLSCGSGATENIFGKDYLLNDSVMHIPNSIDINKFVMDKTSNLIQEKKRKLIQNSIFKFPLIIGHIGRFHPQKNHQYMIEIIKELAEQKVPFLWLFIGDGPLLVEIKKEIEKERLSDYVLFLGRRNDIPELLNAMDIFVLPSLYEGLPTVAVEAQAAGVKSIFSTEITDEVDLGMNLATFISLDNKHEWIDNILIKEEKSVSNEFRIQKLKEKKFTNEESSQLYKKFLNGEIKSYKI